MPIADSISRAIIAAIGKAAHDIYECTASRMQEIEVTVPPEIFGRIAAEVEGAVNAVVRFGPRVEVIVEHEYTVIKIVPAGRR